MIAYLAPHPILRDFFIDFNVIMVLDCKEDLSWKINNIDVTISLNSEFRFDYADFRKILQMISQSGPTISRHYDCLPEFELEIRKIAFSVLGLAQILKKNDIKLVIFPTVASHHLDSLILEFAARLIGIPQIFHALSLKSNRRFPVLQRQHISDRVPLNYRISNYQVVNGVSLSGEDSWKAPIISPARSYSKTFVTFVTMLLLGKTRNLVGSLKRRLFLNLGGSLRPRIATQIDSVSDTNFTPIKRIAIGKEIELALKHWRAIRYYKSCTIQGESAFSNTPTPNESNRPKCFVIAAHFQPEVSTFPEGGEFYNFIDIVLKIRSIGVTEPIIYKEHPAMFYLGARYENKLFQSFRGGCARSIEYYRQLQSLGVLFVDSSFELIGNQQVIPITITGSIAIERSLIGLKTVAMGQPYFKGLPGLISLENAVKLLKDDYLITPDRSLAKRAENFLTKMESNVTLDFEALVDKSIDEKRLSVLKMEYTKLITFLSRDFL